MIILPKSTSFTKFSMSKESIAGQRTFYYWLDPIRALAATLVLLVHVRSVMFETYGNLDASSQNIFTVIFFAICGLGGFAVCLFYILSGFLVGGKSIEKAMQGILTPRRFFLDRLFRIGVPLSGALVLICIVNGIIGQGVDWVQLFGQYLGLQGVLTQDYGGVFWTLPYEIWFYAAILAILLICGKKRHILTGSLVLMLALMVFCNLVPHFLYILVCGIICYLAKDYKFSSVTLRVLWCLTFMLFIIYFLCHVHYFAAVYGFSDISAKAEGPTQIALFTAIALVLSQYVGAKPHSRAGIMVNNIGRQIAVFSYSLFLTHYQVLKIWEYYMPKYKNVDLTTMSSFLMLCLACIFVAYVFYYIFERNTRKIQSSAESVLNYND